MKNKECKATGHKSKIGGQALIEGVMMRGIDKAAMSVRLPDGGIDTECWEVGSLNRAWYHKTPIVRGVVNFIGSMVTGYKCMMKSAEKAGMEDEFEGEPSKFDLWLEKHLGEHMMKIIGVVAMVFGVALALVLFMFLPALAVKGIQYLFDLGVFKSLVEGVIKIIIFILYLALVSRMKEIKRVFGYHGAEHKSIACYEAGEELTVENVKKHTRFHPRCGTSFILIVLVIGILVFSVVTWNSLWMRVVLKLALLPVVMGVAYEIIKLAGRYDNIVTRIISAPGLWLQRLTTNEPDDSQMEVAIAALTAVLPDNKEEDQW
ncbi:MAG: DUF1385 domain-containing protein [Clostridiales bacterium]|nr:DUF1385 domain-containing protein [Clostridiales bacterium]